MATKEEISIVNIPDRFIKDETEKIAKADIQKQTRLTDIAAEITELREKGFFNYINNIQPLDLFFYLVIILSVILLSEYIPISINHIVGLSIGIIYVFYLQEGKRASSIDKLKTTEIQMERLIPRPSFFYQDANFIDFAYNMMHFRKYNKHAYFKMIEAMDHFLQIQLDIENSALQNCAETYQVALDMKSTALNELHSLIHAIPHDHELILETKLKNAIKTLQLYFERHLDEMREICNSRSDEKGWNIFTNKIDKYAIPGFDDIKMPDFHLF